MSNIVVFGGTSHPELVQSICDNLSIKPSEVKLGKFSNGETSISVGESVREKDVYVIQSGCGHVNDNFMELLILIAACKTASAKRVTAVLPLFPYSRQPDVPFTQKGAPLVSKNHVATTVKPNGHSSKPSLDSICSQSQSRIPTIPDSTDKKSDASYMSGNSGYKLWVAQSGTLIANLLTTSGADHVITMDLHDQQFQGFFNIPVDNLYARPLMTRYITHQIPDYQNAVIVSPDAGGAKRASAIADQLELSFALIHKEKRSQLLKGPPDASLSSGMPPASSQPLVSNPSTASISTENNKYVATTMLVGDVRGKVCVILDDLVDTSYTITRAARLLKEQGATTVYALVTHGVFSGDALNRIANSDIDHMVVTDSVPQKNHVKALGKDRLEVLHVGGVFSESIRRIHNGESISTLFEHGW